MHIPGQGLAPGSCANKDGSRFENQIRWPARPILSWGVSNKGTAENYKCKP